MVLYNDCDGIEEVAALSCDSEEKAEGLIQPLLATGVGGRSNRHIT